MQIHTVKVPTIDFNQSPSLKFIMTFQRLLILSIYRRKKNKDIKVNTCHLESGNYQFCTIEIPFLFNLYLFLSYC